MTCLSISSASTNTAHQLRCNQIYIAIMEDTEKYLNSILQKRMGSVINQSAASKNAHTVTRLPRQEEKIESMPTVFRKKYETVYHSQSMQQAESMARQSQALMRQSQAMGSVVFSEAE